jgi:hypothetical protein
LGDLRDRTSWVRANTPASAVLMTDEPYVDYLYGGRKTLPVPENILSLEALPASSAATRADYFLVAPSLRWLELPRPLYNREVTNLIEYAREMSAAGHVRLVYTSADGRIQVFAVEDR